MPESSSSTDKALNQRAQHFLKVLVERYIQDGQPVGSRTLARDAGLELSPATVRNVMSDLEERGLVSSPHTSAGRIPTAEGLRLFVDSLLTVRPLEQAAVEHIRREFNGVRDAGLIAQSASRLLSGITHMAGVVMLPRHERVAFRHVEFLSLSSNRVLVILVTNGNEVHNRIIQTKRAYSASELEQAANYLNRSFPNRDLRDIGRQLRRELRETREHMDRIMTTLAEVADQVIEAGESQEDCVIAGQTNLMDFNEFASMDRLRLLFDAFTEKHEILHLLEQCLHAQGVQIFIGQESRYGPLDLCSVVTAPYSVDDKVLGVLGVIGPTRMAYEYVIPVVDVTAKLLGAALNQR